MHFRELLSAACAGSLNACKACSWAPSRQPNVGFGVSCSKHGVDIASARRAISMLVLSDPADTTPHVTGRLCFVCNSRNPTDRTAQHAFALWRAAVSLADDGSESCRYLDRHYWTNSVLHGLAKRKRTNSPLWVARRHCSAVLRAQIETLAPRVLIASGQNAANSLHDLGLLSVPWEEYSPMRSGSHREVSILNGQPIEVFATYHTSATGVNCAVSKLYDAAHIEPCISQKARVLADRGSVEAFLARYAVNRPNDAESRGMRVLLAHWLDIGSALRNAYSSV